MAAVMAVAAVAATVIAIAVAAAAGAGAAVAEGVVVVSALSCPQATLKRLTSNSAQATYKRTVIFMVAF